MTASSSAKPAVGFIGLGVMGRPMAGHLLDAGYPLTVWGRRPASTEPLAEMGAAVAATPATPASGAKPAATAKVKHEKKKAAKAEAAQPAASSTPAKN